MNADVEKAVDELRAACGDGSFAMSAVSTADVLTALQALRDQEAEIARLRQWRGLVEEHNAGCEAACDMDRCGYRPYFENNGRRCSECPHFNTIEIPAHLGAQHD